MVGYGEGPNVLYFGQPEPYFRNRISVSNETGESIKYIGLYGLWGSFEYEILNGKASFFNDQFSIQHVLDGIKGNTSESGYTYIPNNGYLYDLFNKK